MNKILNKADLPKLFAALSKDYDICGPVRKGNLVLFDTICSFDDLVLDVQTDYPPKKYFLSYPSKVFCFVGDKIAASERSIKRIVIMKPCDANAIEYLDRFYLGGIEDSTYAAVRRNTFIFVFDCKEPGGNCFCTTFGTDVTTNYDLMFTDKGSRYLVNIGSPAGSDMTLARFFSDVLTENENRLQCRRLLSNPNKLQTTYVHPIWEKNSKDCLGCCACTAVCPTCTCFDISDEVELDLKTGVRRKTVSSCQSAEFTRVAGDHVFRTDRQDMFKHRYYCKLNYSKENFNKPSCVGCGRCISVCPADIDMVETVNGL